MSYPRVAGSQTNASKSAHQPPSQTEKENKKSPHMSHTSHFTITTGHNSAGLYSSRGKVEISRQGMRNLGEEGLPSADRNNKATLLLTGPFRATKSSAKDSIPRAPKLQFANHRNLLHGGRHVCPLGCEAEAYSYPSTTSGRCHRVLAWILT